MAVYRLFKQRKLLKGTLHTKRAPHTHTQQQQEQSQQQLQMESKPLVPDGAVVINGLQQAVELNGQQGRCQPT